jgi:hypothetical protein
MGVRREFVIILLAAEPRYTNSGIEARKAKSSNPSGICLAAETICLLD